MKPKTILVSTLLLVTGGLAAAALQDEGMPIAKPGPEHGILKKMAGTWTAEADFMGMKETGTYERKLAMNGLWLLSEYEGKMMGTPFVGHEITGWDPMKKKYVSCWVDSASTSMSIMEGTWDPSSKSMTLTGASTDPMSGDEMAMINVTRMPDDDHMIFDMHMGSVDSPAMMTITYTRQR